MGVRRWDLFAVVTMQYMTATSSAGAETTDVIAENAGKTPVTRWKLRHPRYSLAIALKREASPDMAPYCR